MLLKLEEKKVKLYSLTIYRLGRKLKTQKRKLEKSCKLDKEMKSLRDKRIKE